MNSLKKDEGVSLLNFVGDPGVPLLNFEESPGVPLLNFERGPDSRVPVSPRCRVSGSWSHFDTMPLTGWPTSACSYRKFSSRLGWIMAKSSEISPRRASPPN